MRPSILTPLVFVALGSGCIATGAGEDDRVAQEAVCPSSIPAWAKGTFYSVGSIVAYKSGIFRCLQPHTAIETWTPEAAASLWQRVTCTSSLPPSTPSGGGCDAGGTTTPPSGGSDAGAPSTDSGGGSTDTGTPSTPPSTPPSGKTEVAPYFYTWGWGNSSYPITGLVDMKSKAGQANVTLAFVLSNGGCAPSRDIQDHLADVKAFVAAGGHVKASFGGANGTYLDNACGDSASLAKAISDFVSETGITDLDFDVEQGGAMGNDINKKRAAALAKVQKDKGVRVAFTLACTPRDKWDTPGGLSAASYDVVATAVAAGVDISYVNLMTMDYGSYYSAGKTMGDLAISAATDTVTQLKKLMPSLSDSAAWAKIGITPMIGINDVSSEVFSITDAKNISTFAKTKGVGLLAFWAINRDQPGSGSLGLYSGAQSKNFEFLQAFKSGL